MMTNGSKRMAAGATVAGLAALMALVLVLQFASVARQEVRMGLLTTKRQPGNSDLAIDQQLRADIVRLKVRIDNSGANYGKIHASVARRFQSEASVRSTGDTKMEKEMDAMRRELKSIKDELSDTRHAQRPLTGLAYAKPCIPGKGQNCLPTVKGKDKKHCLFPLVWARGKCESSPRARFLERTPAQIKERGIACAPGEESTSCLEYERAERQQQIRELNQYELDLRKSSDFQYHPLDHKNTGEWKGSPRTEAARVRPEVGSLGYDLTKALRPEGSEQCDDFF